MRHPVPRYSFLAFQLNALLDQGISEPIDEVRDQIDDGTLLDRLEAKYRGKPHYFDVSPYDAGERRTIMKVFQAMGEIDASRKLGVEHNGISLALAYCVEVLQHPDTYGDYRFDE